MKKMIFHNTIFINGLIGFNMLYLILLFPFIFLIHHHILSMSLGIVLYDIILPLVVFVKINQIHFNGLNTIHDAKDYNVNDDSNLGIISIISSLINLGINMFFLNILTHHLPLSINFVFSLLSAGCIFSIAWCVTFLYSLGVLGRHGKHRRQPVFEDNGF